MSHEQRDDDFGHCLIALGGCHETDERAELSCVFLTPHPARIRRTPDEANDLVEGMASGLLGQSRRCRCHWVRRVLWLQARACQRFA